MTALDNLPVDILHHIAQPCSKSELLSLRLSCRSISSFLLPYVAKYLAFEVRFRMHSHLHKAAAASDNFSYTMLSRLLRAKAPVDQRNECGETALHVACRHGNIRGVCSLLDVGADVETVSFHQWTPLRLACRYGNIDIARLLLDFGADVNKSGLYGWTALHYAVQNGHWECAKLLVRHGATDTVTSQNSRRTAAKGVKQQWGIYKFHVRT